MELTGYGDGDGSGSGYGDGSGSGSGYGYGSGSGDGSGSGSGDGSGSGYGYGYGDGDGSGSGSGYGYGDGSGYGDGKENYLAAILGQHQTTETAALAFWRSTKDGLPANGGKDKQPATVGLVQTISGPLEICRHALHATTAPEKWKGERWWVVALHHPIVRDEDKIASLKREIIADLGRCPF